MTDTPSPPPVSFLPRLRLGALRLLLVAGALGLCANALFVRYLIGLNVPLFTALTFAALFALASVERVRPAWRNVWLIAPLMYFAVMIAIRAEPLTTLLNVGLVLGLMALIIYYFSSGSLLRLGAWGYLSAALITGVETWVTRPGLILFSAWDEGRRTGLPPRAVAIVRGLALALPIVIVFTALLTSADIAFNRFIRDMLEALSLDDLPELITRIFVTAIVGWACAGGLAYALRDSTLTESATGNPLNGRLGFTESGIILGSVNLLFAAFVIIQFQYFFGGQSNITIDGFTYADYARRGFGELVVVALFTLGLGLILQTLTRRQSAVAVWGFSGLCTLLVAQTGVLLASAFQRLLLYEQAYGFTRLRTYPHVFMIWMGVLLAVFLLTVLVNRPRAFVFGAFLAVMGFVISLNTLNPDAFIARQNILRQQVSGELDAVYLATLSDDALPELLPLLNSADVETQAIIGSALHFRLNQLNADLPYSGWPSWHWSRTQAHTALARLRPTLEQYEPEQYFWRVPID